jgi:hypothetical protein
MSGAIPPLPQYAFMALCSAKAQGQLYLLPFYEMCHYERHFILVFYVGGCLRIVA